MNSNSFDKGSKKLYTEYMAKKAVKTRLNINLRSRGKESVSDVFYKWAVDAGRGIIIGIELIALIALGYRFYIDRKIVDLHDAIDREQTIVTSQTNQEVLYRGIQDRLTNIKSTTDETSAKITIMDAILQAISQGTFYDTTLAITSKEVILDGSTFSIFTLNTFIDSLKQIPSVEAISIDEIDNNNDGIRFKLRINVKEGSVPTPTVSITPPTE